MSSAVSSRKIHQYSYSRPENLECPVPAITALHTKKARVHSGGGEPDGRSQRDRRFIVRGDCSGVLSDTVDDVEGGLEHWPERVVFEEGVGHYEVEELRALGFASVLVCVASIR